MASVTVYFAVAGDVHGRWAGLADDIRVAAGFLPDGAELSAVFQVGDAEPTADEEQLAEVHIKPERRRLSDFADVKAGRIRFPAPVYFIGGNHEPWRTLDENGGFIAGGARLAPDVWFLGRAGHAHIAGMDVAFLSGIRPPDGRPLRTWERARSAETRVHGYYSVEEVLRLCTAGPADIVLTHDWPAGSGYVHKTAYVGDPAVRRALELVAPAASFHGHYHRSDRFRTLGVDVFARGCFDQGVPEAVAVFAFDEDTRRVRQLEHVAS
ncbi:metallophosphoesterase family protein [Microbacterium elymi]|uniref:Metallophosphoesterase n=1 Tax=Microbacterium elymi TaxID=2909587 RepID=A0ABY5NHD0_9MICO|nr:metallophosphoesterase family protein [Microbacterium elymi]UUT34553.1 metallophosphoesterase [Microbacterium elymi]